MTTYSITAASKDYNARGKCRHHWFRMLWTGSAWDYFGAGRLPNGNFLAADRCATVRGDVETGDVLLAHDRGGPVDKVRVVTDGADGRAALIELPFRRRNGKLLVSVPFEETEREYPDPRR